MWNRLYEGSPLARMPWFTQAPYPPLVEAVDRERLQPPGPLLDVGCGLGTNAIWLASQGFHVTGIDVASGAIEAAKTRETGSRGRVTFLEDDILSSKLGSNRFRAAVDVGCFQTLPRTRRREYVEGLARALKPDGVLLMYWVAREETGPWGPPHRLSVGDVVNPFESRFRVAEIEFRPRAVPLTAKAKKSGRPLSILGGYTARFVRRRVVQPPAV
jgi:SAM-dependent methyltransferase